MEIPFRVGEVVAEPHFVGRRAELARLQQALWSRGRLLVVAPRAQGKRSAVEQAFAPVRSRGGILLRADLRTTESLSELLRGWVEEVPGTWRQRARLLETLRGWGLRPEASAGGERIRLGIRERMLAPGEAERHLLELLKWLDGVAAHHPAPVALGLDEVQQVAALHPGGFDLLRSWLAATRHLAWILTASAPRPLRPLGDAVPRLELAPIPAEEMAGWLEKRIRAHGVEPEAGVGLALVRTAGPVTGDRVRLARAAFLRSLNRNRLGTDEVEEAAADLALEGARGYENLWQELPTYQRAVIRAVAAGTEQLHSQDAAFAFDLPVSSAVSKAVRILRDKGHLTEGTPTRLADPFFRGWVVGRAMVP
jgi:hypothetical protein